MKIIKLGFISFLVFSVVIFLISLLIPSQVHISRAIDMHADQVDKTIADLNTWPKWNELYNDSVQVQITDVTSSIIKTSWISGKNTVPSSFRIERSAGVTVVQWQFDFTLKWYPWQKFGSILFDKEFGTPMEQSLNNLKKLAENSP